VCVLRVESRDEAGLLITVLTTPDISVKSPAQKQSVTRPAEALTLVADFLRAYARAEFPAIAYLDVSSDSANGDD
jgi:hypothetical protein